MDYETATPLQAPANAAATKSLPLAPTIGPQECAALLRCSKATVERLALQGELPATQFGRGWTFVTEQIIDYLKERCAREAEQRRKPPAFKIEQRASSGGARRRPGRPRKRIPGSGFAA